ncbi:XRE family transcriptional regulator, aerobic/anaerobic benzoate catabolism transcriptional regulator [Acidiphilium sp. MT5]|jgi:XRE family aerobic/anaerobic benzoate catabolism transcriptional regulator
MVLLMEMRPPKPAAPREPLLVALGERVRLLRARKAMPRRVLALTAKVSERHLANLESGIGNVSVLVLQLVAQALDCPIAELLGDETTATPEWLMIRESLRGRGAEDLQRAQRALEALFDSTSSTTTRLDRIALIGLRGAGKSSLGRLLAQALGRPFVELGREITRIAGGSLAEIQDLYGPTAYRRYERQALEAVLADPTRVVIETSGGLVSNPTNFSLLLGNCFTIWLRAAPEDHMKRVIDQGDLRPLEGSDAAMEDLRMILAGRAAFYAKADLIFDTSGKSLEASFEKLLALVRMALNQD